MKALTYHLRLLEPVLVAQAESGEENSAISLPFIPGSALRGALIARYLRDHYTDDLAGDDTARRLFFDGSVCYLNAYPWIEHYRLLPKPMSWFTEKIHVDTEGAEIWDLAVNPEPEQPKSPKEEFCKLTERDTILYSPSRQVNVHIALQDPNRRGAENTVYRYDALAEGEVFAGVVLAEDEADLKTIQFLFKPDEIHIGRAHTAGYGRVKIVAQPIIPSWDEYTPGEDPENGKTIVTFLSDIILRGKNGQLGGGVFPAVAQVLGLPEGIKPENVYFRLRLVAGFNRKWSLPLVQTWAIEAGSTFVYKTEAGADPEVLHARVEKGIGERRVEGFGRVAINWQTQPEVKRTGYRSDLVSPPTLSPASKELAGEMAKRRLRILLDSKLVAAVNGVGLNENLPQNAQLSRVRNAVQQALLKKNISLISDHLNNLKKVARNQFETARAANIPMLNWITERVEKQDVLEQIWRSDPMPAVAGETALLTDDLKIEYTARLIDGVMKKAIRQNQQ
ncbi:MAG: hypothetical protein KJ606_08725 [Chloroflexi bacterium]|nr:hypothetical protein [Chloroflexota bacterium]